MPDTDSTAELTRRITTINPKRINPPRHGKIWEWLETLETAAAWTNDWTPATAAIATLLILASVTAR